MPQANDWLFDMLWDLSDKAHGADLPAVAEKLEEAMDTLLLESQPDGQNSVEFRSGRYADANRRIMDRAQTKAHTIKALNALMSQSRARGPQHAKVAPKSVARPKPVVVSGQQVGASFAWPF